MTFGNFFNRTVWHKDGGIRSKKPLAAHKERIRLEFTPLPGTEELKPDQRQAMIRRRCRELEQSFKEKRKRPSMTPAKMSKIDHRDRPKTKPTRTPKPICHAATEEAEKQFREAYQEFFNAYIVASAAYREGAYETEFPSGSYRPPLVVIAAA